MHAIPTILKHIAFLAILIFSFVACTPATTADTDASPTDSTASTSSTIDSIAMLNQLIIESPNNQELYLNRARKKADLGQLEEAIKDVRRAMIIDSSKASIFELKGDLLFAQRKIKEAAVQYAKATVVDPSLPEPHLKLAETYMIVANYIEAMDHINNALKADIYNAKAYYLKGMTYKFLKDTLKAVSSFQTAVEQDADFYEPYIQLGIIYAAKRNTLAEAYYNNALRIAPNSLEALYNKAMFYQDMEEVEAATATYRLILSLRPDYALAAYNLGYLKLVYEQQFDSAGYYFSQAVSSEPNYYQAYFNRGICNEYLGYFKEAQTDYKKALSIKPDYTPAAQGLNRILDGKPLRL